MKARRYAMMRHGSMVAEDDSPVGAPVLPESGRDRLSVWVAEHGWAVPIMRLVVGLSLVAVSALVFGTHLPWGKVVVFVIGARLGGEAGEREKQRGDRLLETLLSGGHVPAPPEAMPREFAEYAREPPDPRMDGRYLRYRQ
jgi:hypothetical protein